MIGVGDPALDAAGLERFVKDVDDAAFTAGFIALFRRLLPHRLDRISQALGSGDLDDALDASLSLKAAARTLGASELAALAHGVELRVRDQDLAAAREQAAQLPLAGRRAQHALAAYVAGPWAQPAASIR